MTDNEKDVVEVGEGADPLEMVSGYCDDPEDAISDIEPKPETEEPKAATEVVPDAPSIDRERLGTLLRQGQRYSSQVASKIAMPEFHSWARDVQHFLNEFGL